MSTKTLHFGSVIISRSKPSPDNAVAACAYRSGQNLYDEKLDKSHNYANRKGVVEAEIFAPEFSPGWMKENNWARFGNEIEKAEDGHNRRNSALLAKDFQVAAPRELSEKQNWQLACNFSRKINERRLAVAVAFHIAEASDGGENPHFHFLVPMREVNENGFGKRYRKFDGVTGGKDHETMKLRREYFACVKEALADAGIKNVYYDPEKQIGKKPKAHKGKHAAALEKQGVETFIEEYNYRVDIDNTMDSYYGTVREDWEKAKHSKNWEAYEKYRLRYQLGRGSAMAARDATQKTQSNVAAPAVNRSEKATEIAREGAKLASRQSKTWQERVTQSREDKGRER